MNPPQPSEERYVWALLQGAESELKIDLLLSLTKITSQPVIAALKAHYVEGTAQIMCETIYDISQQQFSRGKVRLNEVYATVQQLLDVK